jgi:hypothetical protein
MVMGSCRCALMERGPPAASAMIAPVLHGDPPTWATTALAHPSSPALLPAQGTHI